MIFLAYLFDLGVFYDLFHVMGEGYFSVPRVGGRHVSSDEVICGKIFVSSHLCYPEAKSRKWAPILIITRFGTIPRE